MLLSARFILLELLVCVMIICAHRGKIAFLFMTRGPLPHAILWENFFTNSTAMDFQIFVHAPPGVVLDRSTVASPLFYGRTLSYSFDVRWGELSQVYGELALYTEAFADIDIDWFVLLSEHCIPVQSFSFVHQYLFSSNVSFIESYKTKVRYNKNFNKTLIPKNNWRKGANWCVLKRRDVNIILSNTQIVQEMTAVQSVSSTKIMNMDEHYKQIILDMKNVKVDRRSLTFFRWDRQKDKQHPVTFRINAPNHHKIVRGISELMCTYESIKKICFLFARKFIVRQKT